jgi:hypothetical protein
VVVDHQSVVVDLVVVVDHQSVVVDLVVVVDHQSVVVEQSLLVVDLVVVVVVDLVVVVDHQSVVVDLVVLHLSLPLLQSLFLFSFFFFWGPFQFLLLLPKILKPNFHI